MDDTFVIYQVSPKETIRYEMPMALKPQIDEWASASKHVLGVGLRGYPKTIARWIAVCFPECPELFNRIKITKTPTPIWPRGHKGTVTVFDYPI